MVTNSPNHLNVRVNCSAFVKLDDTILANMTAYGISRTTGHAAVYAKAGQRVCVESVKDGSEFDGNWVASFTGFLVCPDV
jgi:hypothetical protein